MLDLFDVCDWFLNKEAMNQEKLSDLVYLSYAWFWTVNQKELFPTEGFEAFALYPCDIRIIEKYKGYQNKKLRPSFHIILDDDLDAFLESVYSLYGCVDGDLLSSYIRKSTPYLRARKNQQQIKIEDMIEYYKQQV